MSLHEPVHRCLQTSKAGSRFSAPGITDSCEPPSANAGNHT